MRALSVGPGAVRVLAAGGRGGVVMRGYALIGSDGWLHLADERTPRGPLTLTIAGLRPPEPGTEIVVCSSELKIGPFRIPLGGVHETDSAPGLENPASEKWGLTPFSTALAAALSPLSEVRAGLRALAAGDTDGGVALLAGLGPGLTPAGDDVLAGYAFARRVELSPAAADRASPLGLAYLRCAERGEVAEPLARTVDAIARGDARTAGIRARALSTWGATSGAAMLWGVAAGASAGSAHVVAA